MTPRRSTKKLFVLDTNVILYDHTCIYNFAEHDVAISIVVLEELDTFKRGNDPINTEARQFIRANRLAGSGLLTEGLSLGDDHGRLFVEVGEAESPLVSQAFTRSKPDNRILALADVLRRTRSDRQVILVSKDINLRMKAKSLGIPAEDYETGKILHVDRLYTGTSLYDGLSSSLISRFHAEPHAVPVDELPIDASIYPHQYFIMRNGSVSALARFNRETAALERVLKRGAYGIDPRNAEQTFALDALLDPEIPLVTLTGKAGTGKTLLALAAALEQRRNYRQIFLARPIVPLSNKDLGYLPGDIKSKLDPYMQPLYDNLA